MDRRAFLMGTGAIAAGTMLGLPARAADEAPRPRPRNASSIYVDGQGGLGGLDQQPDGSFVPSQRLVEAIREGRLDLLSMTIGAVGNGPDRFRNAAQSIAGFDRMIADNASLLAKVERGADIGAARRNGKLGLIYNLQDTTALEANVDNVAILSTLGIKVMQLTYNKRNLAGDGCLERSNAGLSDLGRQIIAKMNSEKVLLDLSHAGQRTISEGIAASSAPMAITHSGCRNLVDFPRNTFDAEMRALADKGGVFGVYLMPFLRTSGQAQGEDLLRHLDHALNVCGEDHIGIGTDQSLLGVTANDEARANQRAFFEERARLGIAAPGEAADVLNLVEGYNDAARFDRIGDDLRRRGWSAASVEKLLGGNFVRLFSEVWGA